MGNCYSLLINDEYSEYSTTLLWPVRRWEIIIPQIASDTLNAFERLFLELALIQKDGIDEALISEMGINHQVFARICEHLKEKRLIDNQCKITDRGKETLEGKDYLAEEKAMTLSDRYSVFQDSISGRIIPYISKELPNEEWVNDDAISSGEIMCLPGNKSMHEPSIKEVKQGIRLFYECRAADNNADDSDEENYYEEDGEELKEDYENDWRCDDVEDIEKTTVFRLLKSYDEGSFIFNFTVNPMRVTNNDVDYIWEVKTPFGESCNRIISNWLREIILEDAGLKEKVLQKAFDIRESMKGKIPFRNELGIELFARYPEITLEKNDTLRNRLETLEMANRLLVRGKMLDDIWIVRLSNAVDRILRMHMGLISIKQRQLVALWLNEHKNDYFDQIRSIFVKYHIQYAYLESNYIRNPNTSVYNMLNAANGKQEERMFKKDRALFLLLAAEIAGCEHWKGLVLEDNSIYEWFGNIDYLRNAGGAAHDTSKKVEVENALIEKYMHKLDRLVESYFEEVRNNEKEQSE